MKIKKLHNQFVWHLRSYRMFHFMFFTFILLITSVVIYAFGNKIYAEDLLEKAFAPAMSNETIINLWAGKNAVGNEVLREWVNVQDSFGVGCFVHNERISDADITTQKTAMWSNLSIRDFCEQVLWWDYNTTVLQTEAPLIVRITKFILRITMVLAVTMVIFNGVMWIIESSKWGEVKDAKKNIVLIVVWILIALMSLSIINLISSVTVSSLQTNSTSETAGCSINGSVLVGDNLKAYICENETFGTTYTGTRYPDRIGNRCKRNWSYTAITDSEMISKCIELWGVYQN